MCSGGDTTPLPNSTQAIVVPLTTCKKACECDGKLCDFDKIASQSQVAPLISFFLTLYAIGTHVVGLLGVLHNKASLCSIYIGLLTFYLIASVPVSFLSAVLADGTEQMWWSFLILEEADDAECTDKWFEDQERFRFFALVGFAFIIAWLFFMCQLIHMFRLWAQFLKSTVGTQPQV